MNSPKAAVAARSDAPARAGEQKPLGTGSSRQQPQPSSKGASSSSRVRES